MRQGISAGFGLILVAMLGLSACGEIVLITEVDDRQTYSKATVGDMRAAGGLMGVVHGLPADWDRAAFWRAFAIPGRTDVKLLPDAASRPGEGYRLVMWVNPEGGRRRVSADRLCRAKAEDLPSGPLPTDIVIQAALCGWDRYMTAATLIATTMKPGNPGFQTAANQLMLSLFPLNPKADVGGDSWPR